jgi:N-acetylmuramoyl-L-alanine amidase
MRKLAIIVGHNGEAQGAARVDTGETEFVWNNSLARLIERLSSDFDIEVRVFFRVPGGGLKRELERVYREVDLWGADMSIELHFNGHHNPSARGTETLSSGTALSLRLAVNVQREMVASLGLRDRGVKTVGRGGRGWRSLYSGKAPAIMIEPFFGTNADDCRAADQQTIALAVLRGAAETFATFPRKDLSESRSIKAAHTQRKAQKGAGRAVGGVCVVQVADALTGGAQTPGQAIEAIRPLMDYAPHLSFGLAGIAVVLLVLSHMKTDEIEQARIDDSVREIR